MSIDEVMATACRYGESRRYEREELSDKRMDELRAAIERHAAEAVAKEREECADAARQWEDDYVIEDSAPRHVDAAIRARADHEEQSNG